MRFSKGVFLALLMFAAPALLRAEPAGAARVALLTESARALAASDLLTVELSKQKSLQILERNEIEKVRREQGFSAENQNRLQLGRLLGADGLLLLQINQGGRSTNLAVRLLAVHSGAVLSDWRFDWPLENPREWARGTAIRLGSFAPRLGVLARDAVPISIVNFHSAVQTPQAPEAESVLTQLVLRQLSQEPRIFVLERQSLQLLSQEKEFQGDASAFWNGSHVLDGTLDPTGYSRDTLVVNVRLTPPKGGSPLPAIEVSGNRTNLSEIAARLTTKIKESLKIESAASEWNSAAEAARYFEEAQWALKWRLFQDAAAAAESSWALGQQTREVAGARIRAYRGLAAPDWGDSCFARPTAQNSAPDAGKLEPANRALQLVHQGFQTLLAPESKPDLDWYHLALDVLISTSELLRQFYLFPASRLGHEDQLAELRLLAREAAAAIEEHPAYRNLLVKSDTEVIRSGNEARVEYWIGTRDLATLKAAMGAFWCDTPDQALEIYHELARPGSLHRLRRYLVYRQIVGWTPAGQSRAPDLWRDFIRELCGSTNGLLRVDGFFAAYATARDNPQQEEEARRSLFDVGVENARALAAAGLADQFLSDVTGVIPHSGDRAETKMELGFRSDFRTTIEGGSAAGKKAPLSNPVLPMTSVPDLDSNAFVRVTHFWTIPDAILQEESDYPVVSIAQSCFREGKLWLEAHYGDPLRKAVIFAVDPGNFTSEPINVPLDKLGSSCGLEVLGDFLYLSKSDGISRYGLKTHTWEVLPIPLEGQVPLTIGTHTSYVPSQVRLSIAGGRLFICTRESIMELAEDGHGVQILASTRRRPTMNILDSLENYSEAVHDPHQVPAIVEGSNHSLRTVLAGRLYTCDAGKSDWSESVALPSSPNRSSLMPFAGGSIFRQATADRKTRWWLLPDDQCSIELLLGANSLQRPQKPRWILPETFSMARSLLDLEGDALWMLAGDLNLGTDVSGKPVLNQENGRNLTLLKFDKGGAQPTVSPLWFELKEEGYFSRLMSSIRVSVAPTIFQCTKAGFIITGGHVPGFWFLPHPGMPAMPEISNQGRQQNPAIAFFAAAESGDLAALKSSLAQGVPVDARNHRGWTALMVAAKAARPDIVNFLIQIGADVNARSAQKSGNLALCFAIEGNQPRIITALLDHAANLNARSGAADGTALGYAAMNGKKEAAEILIARGADVNEPGLTSNEGRLYPPLMCAACGDHPELVELLLAKGARLEARNNMGATALMEASKMAGVAGVKALLAKGANVNAADEEGHTALIFAAFNGRAETVKLLLAAGADPNAKAAAVDDFDGKPYDAAEAAELRHYPETAAIISAARKQGAL